MMVSSPALFADLYELTMMQAYLREEMTGQAVFSLFCRKLPRTRNYLIACGLESVLEEIEQIGFTDGDLSFLKSLGMFDDRFLGYLRDFRFTGEISAVAEGTPVFANEPLVEVIAPLPEAQFLETLIVNRVHLQTVLASKASRVVNAARGRPVVDFAARRMHGKDAAELGARAFFIAGVAASSNVAVARRFGIPAAGTMGHSYIQAHESEQEAFYAFARQYPKSTILIDTYDTIEAARRIAKSVNRGPDRLKVAAVRIDSGDLGALSRQVRSLLDDAGLSQVEIFASGSLDEYEIDRLVSSGAPINAFGVGTSMGVSADAPSLDMAYKLTEYNGVGRMKLSAGKVNLPGRKQVFRRVSNRKLCGDVIGLHSERLPGEPLLHSVLKDGKRIRAPETIEAQRVRVAEAMTWLPDDLLHLSSPAISYPVEISADLRAYEERVRTHVSHTYTGHEWAEPL